MKYIVIEEFDIEALIVSVNKLIADGWKLQGGVSHSKNTNHNNINMTFCQALIK
jgi:hypothetical protein